MNHPRGLCGHLLWALAVSAPAASAQIPTFSMEALPPAAVGAQCGPRTHLVVAPGDSFVLQVFLRDWSLDHHGLGAYQVQLNPEGYGNGTRGYVRPPNYNPEWTTQPDDPDNCFVDETHPKFVHRGLANLALTDTVSAGYRMTSIAMRPDLSPVSPMDGSKVYLGSINFVATPDAEGTFTIGFIEDTNNTGLRDERGVAILPAAFETLTVEVRPRVDCHGGYPVASLIEALNGLGPLSDEVESSVDFNCDGAIGSTDLLALIRRATRPPGAASQVAGGRS